MRALGMVLFFGAGVVMFAFQVQFFYQWWGKGAAAAFFVPPLAAIFPFIYLFKEGFSLLYFGVWAVGILGMIIASSDDKK
jgi:hypothetical protein